MVRVLALENQAGRRDEKVNERSEYLTKRESRGRASESEKGRIKRTFSHSSNTAPSSSSPFLHTKQSSLELVSGYRSRSLSFSFGFAMKRVV